MRDIVTILPGGSPSPMESVEEVEDDSVVGCLPSVLSSSHRLEIESIVDEIPRMDEVTLVVRFERYQKLLDLYQEQPNLLDSCIGSLMKRLLAYIHLPVGSQNAEKLDVNSTRSMKFLFHLTKVRGYKTVVKLLPHEVPYLERLLSCLECYTERVMEDLQERAILLYWLWIVCKNPFDLRRFDAPGRPGSTMTRVFNVTMPYLSMTHSRVHFAAALVISQCLARLDGRPLCPQIVGTVLEGIRDNENEGLLGNLILLLAILKHVDRITLFPLVPSIISALSPHFPLSTKNTLVRKCLIKCAQRVALVLLKPRLAKWRYQRGKRCLEEILKNGHSENKVIDEGVTVKSVVGSEPVQDVDMDSGLDDEEEEDEEDEEVGEMVEWSVDCILSALSDAETSVRWSAAKGTGRIAARLHKELASQVVQSVLDSCFHRASGHALWHGGCMSLAELSRRGLLLPEQLPQAFPIVHKALFYEEPVGRHALGSNVRDAACYVIWSWARAYEPRDIAPYVDALATSLICAALFDREVSIRRAASAAFQENVGRQCNFPDGIPLLTLVDYFAVGNRTRCYSSLCVEVAAFPKYADAMVDHLMEYKVTHWDSSIREQCAQALCALSLCHTLYVERKMRESLLEGALDPNPVRRHGFLFSLSHTVLGLVRAGLQWDEMLVSHLASVPSLLLAESKKSKAAGGELTRLALAEYCRVLGECQLPLNDQQVSVWLSLLSSISSDCTESVRLAAFGAAQQFFPVYVWPNRDLLARVQEEYAVKIHSSPKEEIRIGVLSLAACIDPDNLSDRLFDAVCEVIIKRTPLDTKWAFARVRAVSTLSSLHALSSRVDRDAKTFESLFVALDDYTEDTRGDIGRFVRSAAMEALSACLTAEDRLQTRREMVVPAVCKMIQQSAEKIGRTRECASRCLRLLLSHPQLHVIPHRDVLRKIYADPSLFLHDRILPSLSPILRLPEYSEAIQQGLVLSAGGVSDVTQFNATQALTDHLVEVQENVEDLDSFLSSLWCLLSANTLTPRITSAVLRVFPSVLSRMRHVDERPDECTPVANVVGYCMKILHSPRASPTRIRLALSAVAPLLHCEHTSRTWEQAANVLLRALHSTYPVVRRTAAETLYETLCMREDADEGMLLLLAETPWQETGDKGCMDETAREIERMLIGREVA